MENLSLISATELVQEYRSGRISPVEVATAALDAIDTFNPTVNAFVLVDHESALNAAKESEARWAHGKPLSDIDGVPTSIKDVFLTRGWPTLRGSSLIEADNHWDVDAPCVARLREAGAVLLGKTTLPEFAWKAVTDSRRHGVTSNPWGESLTSGGSSGGSATAVGLGMGALSVGTDGGGSIRIPASFTGTVGFKPTHGLIPLFPSSPFGTLAHAGPMARTVTDVARLLAVLVRPDSRDWAAVPAPVSSFEVGLDRGVAGMRIAYSRTLGYGENDPEVEEAVTAAVQELVNAGAEVTEINPEVKDPRGAFEVLWSAAAAEVLSSYGEEALERIDPGLRDSVQRGRNVSTSDFLRSTAVRAELGSTMGQFLDNFDVLITPTMPIAAFKAGQDVPDDWSREAWMSWCPYTYIFNMTQQPALSLPCGLTSDLRPIGMQIVGKRFADATVLRAGHAYENVRAKTETLPTLISRASSQVDQTQARS